MTTGELLLQEILDNPADDNVRLIYADWLQENATSEKAWRHDHAELIRAQCELNKPQPTLQYLATESQRELGRGSLQYLSNKAYRLARRKLKRAQKRHAELSIRASELLKLLRPHLCPVCPVCEEYEGGAACPGCSGSGHTGTISRGFCESVTVPSMRTLFGQALTSLYPTVTVWHPTPWARGLLRKCPALQRIEYPDATQNNEREIWKPDVPAPVWERLKSGLVLTSGSGYTLREYSEREGAIADLSQATLSTLREMVKPSCATPPASSSQ